MGSCAKRAAAVMGLFVLLVCGRLAWGADWTNGHNTGIWSDPKNWSPEGVPPPGDSVTIGQTVNVDVPATISSLSVSGGTLSGSNLQVTGDATVSGSSVSVSTFNVGGTLTLTGATIASSDLTVANISSSGTTTLSGGLHGGAGNITVTGGITTVTFGGSVSGAYSASGGTLNFNNGNLLFSADSSISGQTVVFSSAATINGTYNVIGQTTLNSTVTFNTNVAIFGQLSVQGAVLGTGTLSVVTLACSSASLECHEIDISREWDISNTMIISGCNVYSNGHAYWTGGQIEVNSGSSIINDGTFEIQCDTSMTCNDTVSKITNLGTIEKTSGTLNPGTSISVPVDNFGIINSSDGILRLKGGGTSTAGTFEGDAGGVVSFESASYTLGPLTAFEGDGTVRIAHDLPINNAISTGVNTIVELASGGQITLGANATLNVAGTLNCTGGSIYSANGTPQNAQVIVNANGYLDITNTLSLNNVTLVNSGTASWSGSYSPITLNTGAVLSNTNIFNITTDQTISGSAPCVFNNAGTATKEVTPGTGSTGATSFSVNVNNSGTIRATAGTINTASGGTSTGTFTSDAGTRIVFQSGTFELDDATKFTGQGTMRIAYNTTINGAVTAESPTIVELANNISNVGTSTGTLTVYGTLNCMAGASISGSSTAIPSNLNVTVDTTGTLNISNSLFLDKATLTNNGNATWSGTTTDINCGDGAIFNNAGTLHISTNSATSPRAMSYNSNGTVPVFNNTNTGLVTKDGGAGETQFSVQFNNSGSGSVQALNGTLSFTSGGTESGSFFCDSGTLLKFSSALAWNANTAFTGKGTVRITSGTVTVNGQTTLSADTPFQITAGTLSGASTLTVNGTFNCIGGTLTGSGTANLQTIVTNGPLNFSGFITATRCVMTSNGILTIASGLTLDATNLTSNGTGTWNSASDITFNNGAVFNNASDLKMLTDQAMRYGFTGAMGVFNNSSTATKTAGTIATGTLFTIPVNNTGTITATQGAIILQCWRN